MEVHPPPSPLNRKHRIKNRPTDHTEFGMSQAEEAVRKVLRKLKRTDKERGAILWKWIYFSRIMLSTYPPMTIRRRKRALAFWYFMGRRLVRRATEQSCFYQMRAIVEAWVPFRPTRPKSWSKRGPLRCLICIFDYLQESEPRERRRKKRAAYLKFERPTQCSSMYHHMQVVHNDLGRCRRCVVCKGILNCESEAFRHQIVQHLNIRPADLSTWT